MMIFQAGSRENLKNISCLDVAVMVNFGLHSLFFTDYYLISIKEKTNNFQVL